MKPHLPTGQSDFRRIRSDGDYYVDKTLLIKDVIDSNAVVLATRPRRFGKTLSLTTLRYFYGNDEDHTRWFHGLKIMDAGEKYLQKMGKHPVIFMSFKDIKDEVWKDAYDGLWKNIWGCTEDFDHIYPDIRKQMKADEQEILDRFHKGKILRTDYEKLLKALCHALYLHHGTEVVVLIDEYDTPLNTAWLEGYYDKCIAFMRDFLSGLKDNPWLEKAVLTGVVRVSKESLFSGLNSLTVWSVTDSGAADKYGFTEDEVEALLRSQELNGSEMDNVKKWYNGYTYGDFEIYNPWSILQYAGSPRDGFRPHWVNTSDNVLLRKLFFEGGGHIRNEIDALIQGQWLTKVISNHLVYRELETAQDAVWNMLLATGYLKCRNITFDPVESHYVGELSIPNLEVKHIYAKSIRDWSVQMVREDRFTEMVNYLAKGNMYGFEVTLHNFLTQVASYYDTAEPQTENFYHALFLGMLGHFSGRFIIKSNREAGLGRYDIALLPRQPGDSGVVIEIKSPNTVKKETLRKALNAAKKQLKENVYAEDLRSYGAGEVIQVALAVEGKQFLVKKL